MPVRIPDALPATRKLQDEGIFVMTESRATHQDIRPLKIAILNLMPTKEITETQLLRLIGNSPLQVDITLLHTATHVSKHTSADYLNTFYRTFDDIRDEQFDGFIITGAPVEQYEFENVDYWDELAEIMDWTDKNVYTTLFICWAAQAGLYHFYNIKKHPVDKKIFGVFPHKVYNRQHNLTRGFDDVFYAPHSRHTEILAEDIIANDQLDLLCESDEAGVYIAASKDGRRLFVTGHSEYDADTLGREYMRDVNKGLDIDVPVNYYPNDDPARVPVVSWRAHAHLLFGNWLNYFVYQETPFDISAVKK